MRHDGGQPAAGGRAGRRLLHADRDLLAVHSDHACASGDRVDQIFVVARIDSIRTPTAFTFDPGKLYIGSPGQTEHGGAFDLTISTAQPTPVPAGGLPYSLGDMAVAYRTADRHDVYVDHAFRLEYDGRGVLVHQSHADTRATERSTCNDASVFTG